MIPLLKSQEVEQFVIDMLRIKPYYTITKKPKSDGIIIVKCTRTGTEIPIAQILKYNELDELRKSEISFFFTNRIAPELPSNVAKNVISTITKREEAGFKEYGTTLDRKDFTAERWVNEALEEAIDLSLYLQKLKMEMNSYMKVSNEERRLIEAYRKSQN